MRAENKAKILIRQSNFFDLEKLEIVSIFYVIDFTIIRYFFRLLVRKGLNNLGKIVQILNGEMSSV